MIYGASGYTGSLIAREAVRRSLRPILAGRSAGKLSELAGEVNLEHRIFSLDSPSAVVDGIRGVHTLLNCAGPFSQTARPMAEACLKIGTHYLDITGEARIFEWLAARDAEAKAAGQGMSVHQADGRPGNIVDTGLVRRQIDDHRVVTRNTA